MPTMNTIRRHFGSYGAALQAAGAEPARRFWTEGQILEAMRRWRADHGRLPTSVEWSRSGADHPHATTVRQRFGSWARAASAAAR
jgi:hypothetical protein